MDSFRFLAASRLQQLSDLDKDVPGLRTASSSAKLAPGLRALRSPPKHGQLARSSSEAHGTSPKSPDRLGADPQGSPWDPVYPTDE